MFWLIFFLAPFQVFGDVPHVKTGATALHVSGAKGYIKVMGILLQAGAAVNAQVSIVLITLCMNEFVYILASDS